jgi:prevent-host-death family protein
VRVLNIQQAKTHLSRLVEQALAGEKIVIAKAGRPCVQLTPWAPEGTERTLGGDWEGKVRIAPDFDVADPAVFDLFGGGAPAASSHRSGLKGGTQVRRVRTQRRKRT